MDLIKYALLIGQKSPAPAGFGRMTSASQGMCSTSVLQLLPTLNKLFKGIAFQSSATTSGKLCPNDDNPILIRPTGDDGRLGLSELSFFETMAQQCFQLTSGP